MASNKCRFPHPRRPASRLLRFASWRLRHGQQYRQGPQSCGRRRAAVYDDGGPGGYGAGRDPGWRQDFRLIRLRHAGRRAASGRALLATGRVLLYRRTNKR